GPAVAAGGGHGRRPGPSGGAGRRSGRTRPGEARHQQRAGASHRGRAGPTAVAGDAGRLRADHRDKERQLQHSLELGRPLAVLQGEGPVRILDAGCGKASMSLALLLYARRLGRTPTLIGLDRDPGVTATVAGIAAETGE